jgi:hypothetical protein
LRPIAARLSHITRFGRSSAATKLRSSWNSSHGAVHHMYARMKVCPVSASSPDWPKARMIGARFHSVSQYGGMAMIRIHSPARKVRRTSRTAFDRCPNAVAIIGDAASSSPSSSTLNTNARLIASVVAASGTSPSRPIRMMSVAWITCCVRLARISGQASVSVARSSLSHGALVAGAGFTAVSMAAGP